MTLDDTGGGDGPERWVPSCCDASIIGALEPCNGLPMTSFVFLAKNPQIPDAAFVLRLVDLTTVSEGGGVVAGSFG